MYLNSLTLDIKKLRFFDRPSASKVMVHAFRKTSRPTPEGVLPLLRSRVNTLHIACLQAGRLPKNSLIVYLNLSSRWMFSAPFSDILTTEYL